MVNNLTVDYDVKPTHDLVRLSNLNIEKTIVGFYWFLHLKL